MINSIDDLEAWNNLLSILTELVTEMRKQNTILDTRLRDIYYGTLGER